jgi:excisionase family DNA binding protein
MARRADAQPLTLREAAARLGLSPKTLRTQASIGHLKARKLGRDWIVDAAEVDRYAREQKRPA